MTSFTPIFNQELEQGKLMVVVDSKKYPAPAQAPVTQSQELCGSNNNNSNNQ